MLHQDLLVDGFAEKLIKVSGVVRVVSQRDVIDPPVFDLHALDHLDTDIL